MRRRAAGRMPMKPGTATARSSQRMPYHDDDVDDDVDQGRRGECFEHLKREFLHRPRCAVSSMSPMVSATEEFLMMLRNSEVSGGRMMRKAIGSST